MSTTPVADRDVPLVGAFEADAWAGLVFVLGRDRGLALRLAVEHGGHRLEPRDLFLLAREVGPCAPDGAYARVAFDLTLPLPPSPDTPIRSDALSERSLTWEWARLDARTVAIRITAVRPVTVLLECGAPWSWEGVWSPTPAGLAGWAGTPASRDPRHPDIMLHVLDPPSVSAGNPLRLETAGHPIVMLALVGDHGEAVIPPAHDVAAAIDRADAAHASRRVVTGGAWVGLADSIANNIHWMVLLQPEHRRRYAPAGRRWIFPREAGGRDDWTIFAWDGFFNALLLSLESPSLAHEMLAAVVDTQYPSGNIPNWRGRAHGTADRSQPPVGAFVTLRMALRTADPAIVRTALPALERWHAWWQRRRRPSGLYAWGSTLPDVPAWVPPWERGASHRQKAAWESGQDDLPNWDDAPWDDATSTLAIDCVDLSALLALDAECLAHLHEMIGNASRAAACRARHAQLCALIDARLWDAARGVYADRLPDGTFSSRVAASNFFPLLAGAGAGGRAAQALQVLLDPARFWGQWIVPTIDRRDPAFTDQQYWRGTIWPPTNLLLYEALRRVQADRPAAALAERSVALFVGDWRNHQVCRENFSSVDGAGGGQRHQSWGPLFAWIGLAELADVSPWDGVRVGSTAITEPATVERLRLVGHAWDVAIGPRLTRVTCDGEELLSADGPVCVRHLTQVGGAWRGTLSAPRDTRVTPAGGAARVVPAGVTHLECTIRQAHNRPGP